MVLSPRSFESSGFFPVPWAAKRAFKAPCVDTGLRISQHTSKAGLTGMLRAGENA